MVACVLLNACVFSERKFDFSYCKGFRSPGDLLEELYEHAFYS